MRLVSALWSFRGFIWTGVKRDFQSRYAGSVLGMLWVFVHPLVTVFLYTMVFSRLMQARIPGVEGAYSYSIYLCAGLIPWIWFSDTLGRCQNVFLSYGNLMKKTNFPRVCLPATEILVSFLNFLVILGVFLIFLVFEGSFPGWRLAWMVPLLVVQLVFASGLGIVLGIFAVFIRDVGQVLSVVLQLGFWLTPIVYTRSILPEKANRILAWNPLAVLTEGYQGVFLGHNPPYAGGSLLVITGVAITALVFGYFFYKKMVGEMVDEL